MGLDAFLFRTKYKGTPDKEVDLTLPFDDDEDLSMQDFVEEVGRWRKNWDVQDYMHQIALNKGLDTSKMFNCVRLHLTKEDLEKAINELESGEFDFFEMMNTQKAQRINEERDHTIQVFNQAIDYINKGFFVYYDSWW